METIAKSDIFFFITSVATIILTLFLAVLLYYLVKISRDLKYISQKAKAEADKIVEDVGNLRENIKGQGQRVKDLASFFSFVQGKTKKEKK